MNKGCKKIAELALFLIVAMVLSPAEAQTQTYVIDDLGTLGGGSGATGSGINAAGDVTGFSIACTADQTCVPQAFLFTNGVLSNLGPGAQPSRSLSDSYGLSVNVSDQVVGYGRNGGSTTWATLWAGGVTTNLNSDIGVASAINDAGQIAGQAINTGASLGHAVVWIGNIRTDIAAPTLVSAGLAINQAGTVAGWAYYANDSHATLWHGTTATDLGAGASGGAISYADGINASEQVVGYAFTGTLTAGNPSQHATLWNGSIATDLGTLGGLNSQANAVNDAGTIVGNAQTSAGAQHAVLWNGTTIVDLNSLLPTTATQTTTLQDAVAINANGWVVANGMSTVDGLGHAYLLRVGTVNLTVNPATLSFGNQSVGSASAAMSITVTNGGTLPFYVGTPVITGDYSQTNNCGASLAVGTSCTIQVLFTPTELGVRSGSIAVASVGASFLVNLSGTGTVSVALNASASTATVGVPVTLTWNASPGTSCSASGGSSSDGWTGTLASSGTQSVVESAAGSYTYGISCVAGADSAQAHTVVIVTQPTVSLSATPMTVTVGQPITLTWTSTNATSCTASGGASGDSWSGTKANSGSATITESVPGSVSYTLTCTSGPASVTATASVTVQAAGSKGGGSLNELTLLVLLLVLAHRMRSASAGSRTIADRADRAHL